jgi:hypothetical protein
VSVLPRRVDPSLPSSNEAGTAGKAGKSRARKTSKNEPSEFPLRLGVGTLAHRSVSYHLRVEAGVRTGGCLCEAVRYSVRGDPVHVGRCHCADCRKESGSAFIVYGQWPVEAFEVSGEISSYRGRGFCPLCGSRLLDPVGPGETLIEIRLGSLDEAPFDLKPEAEVWVKRRESWLLPVEGAAQHDENRP